MKNIRNIIILPSLVFLLMACSEEILDKTPLNAYSDAVLWTSPDLAEPYLYDIYNRIGHGYRNESMMASISDEAYASRGFRIVPYLIGTLDADNFDGQPTGSQDWWRFHKWNTMFNTIQRVGIFIENVDKIPEQYEGAKKAAIKVKTDLLKGEALFLRAYMYHQLVRVYGGVLIFDKPNKLGGDFLTINRATFEETVNFIVKDCNDAAQLLALKSKTTMGKATKEAALALKSRILLFAASDLTADGKAESKLVGYTNPNRTALWTAARDAAKTLIDLGTCELKNLGAPDQEAVAKNYFGMFKAYDLSSPEVIWGKMFLPATGHTHRVNQWNGPNGVDCWGSLGPLNHMVDSYEMKDGSKFFEHFTINNQQYINTSSKFINVNPYYNREPRFYSDILYDSAVWQPRDVPSLIARDPLGIFDRRTRRRMNPDGTITAIHGIDTRKDPYFPDGGVHGGYVMKKFMDEKSRGKTENNQNIWIYFRYAEILLNYAEACLRLGDEETAKKYINIIRKRVALPDFKGDITQALRHERKIELFGEESRFFDIRRWKILEESLSKIHYNTEIIEVRHTDGTIKTTWQLEAATQPQNAPNKKMYWLPISRDEMNKSPQLTQNPGY